MSLIILSPREVDDFDFNAVQWRFLAEGDSWFSIGHSPPWATSNVLMAMQGQFARRHVAVNCATPGDTLAHMHQMWNDFNFTSLLDSPQHRMWWHGLLFSAGGNDLIDACQSPPTEPDASRRIFRIQPEWGSPAEGADRYLSEDGWQRFAAYFRANFEHLLERRNNAEHPGMAIFMHTYALPTVRNAPAGSLLGKTLGPWLYKAVKMYGIPELDWPAVAARLFEKLSALLRSCHDPARAVYVYDSQALAGVTPAAPGTTEKSGDWLNEIHLTKGGYDKVAAGFAGFVAGVLGG